MTADQPYSIKPLTPEDVTPGYVKWFEERSVIEFSDNQYRQFSLSGQMQYVERMRKSETDELYGIFDDGFHIGNVVLSSINLNHERAEVSYIIGEKKYWGKGVATYAVSEAVKLARSMSLRRVYAGCASSNLGSIRVLEKNHFRFEGKRLKHLKYNGVWVDQLDFGRLLE